jgi:hypothetical protein
MDFLIITVVINKRVMYPTQRIRDKKPVISKMADNGLTLMLIDIQ